MDKEIIDTMEVVALVQDELAPLVFPLLAGRSPAFQGAVLADLTAIWLAGHFVAGDLRATRDLRSSLLADHLFAVQELVNINAALIGAPSDHIDDEEGGLKCH